MKSFLPTALLVFGALLGSLLPRAVWAQGPAAPTLPDSLLHVTDVSCKWAKLSWTNGDGDYRALVLTDLTTNLPGPNIAPTQGQILVGSPFFATGGYTHDDGYAVYTGPGSDATVRNLVKGHQYMALLYPYNESATTGEITYLLTSVPDTLLFTTPGCPDVSPTQAATNLQSFPIDCSTIRLSCTPGNGQARLFVIRKSSVIFNGDVSVDQENYLFPSNLYARGFETKFQSACFAVYAGPGSSVTVYGLAPDQMYKWAVYEYNTIPGPDGFPDGTTPFYDQNNIPASFTATGRCTGGEPGKSSVDDKQHQTSDAAVLPGTLRPTSVAIKWHPSITPAHYFFGTSGPIIPAGPASSDGVGSYVVIHNAFTPNALPLPLQNTNPAVVSTVYGQGSPVRPGMDSIYSVKLVYGWTDTTVAITNLRPATTYAVNVFTFRLPDNPGPQLYTYFLSAPQAVVIFTTPSISTPLPVSLVKFAATHRRFAPNVQLNWQTATEINNAGFGIERSRDGRSWTREGFVAGSGNSASPRSYSFLSPYVGAAYYRLRQEDVGGKATYSPISYVRDDSDVTAFGVFPNPATADFTVLGADQTQPVEIYDMFGKRVLVLEPGESAGTVATLAAGIYLVRQGEQHARLVRQ